MHLLVGEAALGSPLMSDFVQAEKMSTAGQALDRLRANMQQTIKGKDDVIELVLVALVAGGHVLIEDLPGVGKTTLAYALSRSMDCSFSRRRFLWPCPLSSVCTGLALRHDRDTFPNQNF